MKLKFLAAVAAALTLASSAAMAYADYYLDVVGTRTQIDNLCPTPGGCITQSAFLGKLEFEVSSYAQGGFDEAGIYVALLDADGEVVVSDTSTAKFQDLVDISDGRVTLFYVTGSAGFSAATGPMGSVYYQTGSAHYLDTIIAEAVPEPMPAVMMIAGLGALIIRRRQR